MQLYKLLSNRNHCDSKYLLSLNKKTKEKEKISPFSHARLDQEHLQENPWNRTYAKLMVSCSKSLAVSML